LERKIALFSAFFASIVPNEKRVVFIREKRKNYVRRRQDFEAYTALFYFGLDGMKCYQVLSFVGHNAPLDSRLSFGRFRWSFGNRTSFEFSAVRESSWRLQTPENLGDVRPTGAQIAGQCGSVRDDASVQKGLVKFRFGERIVVNGLLWRWGWKAQFGWVPGVPFEDELSP
jgi:hypothetical protein